MENLCMVLTLVDSHDAFPLSFLSVLLKITHDDHVNHGTNRMRLLTHMPINGNTRPHAVQSFCP